jgi:hypothetical protein
MKFALKDAIGKHLSWGCRVKNRVYSYTPYSSARLQV